VDVEVIVAVSYADSKIYTTIEGLYTKPSTS